MIHSLRAFALAGMLCAVYGAGAQDLTDPPAPAAVTVQPFASLAVAREFRAPATVMARNRATLAAEITAPVAAIHTEIGETVAAGDVLVELDATDYQLALERAIAALDAADARIQQAQIRLDRARQLSADRYISDDDLLARETDMAVLKADRATAEIAVREARRQAAKATIRAPFAAAVAERIAQVGAWVGPGSPLMTVVELDGREVEAEAPRDAVAVLSAGDSARLTDESGQAWALVVARVSPVVDPASRTVPVRFTFQRDPAPIGMAGTAVWQSSGAMLPADLLVRRDGRLGYFTVADGRARFVPLPNAQEGRPAAVPQPAAGGVVVRGRERLNDGDLVEVITTTAN